MNDNGECSQCHAPLTEPEARLPEYSPGWGAACKPCREEWAQESRDEGAEAYYLSQFDDAEGE